MTLAAVLLAGEAAGSGAGAQTASTSISTPLQATERTASIHGVALNAKTGQPLGRVLVQAEGQSLLTGYDGRFEFSGLNGTTVLLRVKKPGFYAGPEANEAGNKQALVGSPDEVRVRLYPEALLTGTVSAANGDPLAGIQVWALRLIADESAPRWTMAGQASSNGDGQFRLALPGGDYVVETQYMPARPGARGAVLPVMLPAGANGGSAGAASGASIRLASGTEQHLEIHPPAGPSHTVHLQIESAAGSGAGSAGAEFALQIHAHLPNGLVFSPMQSRSERSGEVMVSLPNGSYLLSASTEFRDDAASYGETRVTVADEDVSGARIHLQKALELPVEVTIDPAAGSAATTGAASNPAIDPGSTSFMQQLGIYMQRVNAGVNLMTENVSPASRQGGPVGFSLLPGVYRLRSQGYSQWYIESATMGGTDLLTQEMAVDGSSSSLPLRLVVGNQMATITGTTKLGGQAAESYVYFIAGTPSATPVISARSGADGSFSRGLVPPGSYRVVAMETPLHFDLSDPAVEKQLGPYIKTVTVDAGETGSVDLDAMPASEMKP